MLLFTLFISHDQYIIVYHLHIHEIRPDNERYKTKTSDGNRKKELLLSADSPIELQNVNSAVRTFNFTLYFQ